MKRFTFVKESSVTEIISFLFRDFRPGGIRLQPGAVFRIMRILRTVPSGCTVLPFPCFKTRS